MLPGIDITRTSPETMKEVIQRMNPFNFDLYLAMCLSTRVTKTFLSSSFFDSPDFYLYYSRHDCPKKDRLHRANRVATIEFLNSHIFPDSMQGLDVVVTAEEMAHFLICSHDGDMYFRNPTNWTPELGQADLSALRFLASQDHDS